MEYRAAYKKLSQYGQTHLLRYFDCLDEIQRQALLAQIEAADFSLLSVIGETHDNCNRIEPISVMELDSIRENSSKYRSAGLDAIRAGKIGAVLLAGGMGTRLGVDVPKGMFNIGVVKELYIYECLINNLLDVVHEAGAYIPLLIMTSERTHLQTRDFLTKHGFFGYPSDYIRFFIQDSAPASDFCGRVYLETKSRIATSPNGNGGWFSSMMRRGILDDKLCSNVEWLNVFSVDNVLQRIADPVFIGATLLSGFSCGSKVIKKASPDEKVGVICLENGRPSIVEYYDLTYTMRHTLNEKGEPAYNFGVTLNYLFSLRSLKRIASEKLPVHAVKKKIPYIDDDGIPIEPDIPNGYKFETLILDMVRMMDGCLPFEVERSREFAPVKNKSGVDSIDTARDLLRKNHIEI